MIRIIKLCLRNLDNKHLKKAGGYICRNNKDEGYSPKTLNDKKGFSIKIFFGQSPINYFWLLYTFS